MNADPTRRAAPGADGASPAGSRRPTGEVGAPARTTAQPPHRSDTALPEPHTQPDEPSEAAARRRPSTETWCPSARPDFGSVVFAVRTDDAEHHGVRYLSQALPVTQEILDLADPVDPREVFRFGAPCATTGCVHFTGSRCSLVQRIVEQTAPAVDELPPCRLRARCRWFAEEGGAACLRCPVILTLQPAPDPELARAAAPVLLGMPTMRHPAGGDASVVQ